MADEGFPIFVLGMARSGTTLLQRVLNSLEGVSIVGEHFGFLSSLSKAYFGMVDEDRFAELPREEVRGLLADTGALVGWTNYFGRDRFLEQVRTLLESLCRDPSRQDKHWGFKEVRYLTDALEVDLLALLYPHARFIFIVRHPLDVIVSNRVSFPQSQLVPYLSEEWADRVVTILGACRRWPETTFLLKYEDLIDPKSPRLDECVRWLGFEPSDSQRRVIETTIGHMSRMAIDSRPSATILNPRERTVAELITRSMRKRMGYEWPDEAAVGREPIPEIFQAGVSPAVQRPPLLIRELLEVLATIPCRDSLGDCSRVAVALDLQTTQGIEGDILQMGTEHGRKAYVLARMLQPQEKMILADADTATRFDPPEAWWDALSRVAPKLRRDQVEIRRSEELGPDQRFRFIHLYGVRNKPELRRALGIVANHLAPGGLLLIDSYFHDTPKEMANAVFRFLSQHSELSMVSILQQGEFPLREFYLYRRVS